MAYRILLLFVSFFLISFQACDKKADDESHARNQNKEFGWKDNASVTDIPDFPVKGKLEGKEVQFQYINFERWRGSADNVFNFSIVMPAQDCGFIDDFSGFTLINKEASIVQGEFVKASFSDDPKTYQAFFKNEGQKSTVEWHCALNIESISEKSVTGKIALFFNDEKKSWLAGKFEAIVCNN